MTHSRLPAPPVFTRPNRATLCELRPRYRAGGDLFDANELACLRFIRWLYQTGPLAP